MTEALFNKRYKGALNSLLMIFAFSGLNLVLLLINSDKYFLFSAYMPYLLGDYAMFYGGRYPEEAYKDFPDTEFFGAGTFALVVAVAVAVLCFYLLSFFMAKKGKGVFLIFALSVFILDTLIMFSVIGFSIFQILDIIFHVWAIASLALGGAAFLKKKKGLVTNPPAAAETQTEAVTVSSGTGEYSPVLRDADKKSRAAVFCEADFMSHHIVYQRGKRANELIVDGKVYAEYVIFSEDAHTLEATIDGFKIQAHYDGTSMTCILADGKEIARKRRLI